jgi:hypothetical protein
MTEPDMKMSARKGRTGQSGFVVTAELLLITTVLGLGLLTGMTKLRDQTLAELSDTGSAIGAINQSYTMDGTEWVTGGTVAEVAGFAFTDAADLTGALVGGDGSPIVYSAAPVPSTVLLAAGEEGVNPVAP